MINSTHEDIPKLSEKLAASIHRQGELEYWLREAQLSLSYQHGWCKSQLGPTHKIPEGLRALVDKITEILNPCN